METSQNTDQTLLLQANACFQTDELDQAEALASQYVQQSPEDPQGHSILGGVAFKRKQYLKAIGHFQKTLKLGGKNLEIYMNVGACLYWLKDYQAAFMMYQQALNLEPQSVATLYLLGDICRKRHQDAEAVSYFQQVLALEPRHFHAHHKIAHIFIEQGDYAQAQPHCEKALAIEPRNAAALRNLALAKHYADTKAEEVKVMQALLSDKKVSDEDKTVLNLALGKVMDDCQQYDKAFSHYQTANQQKWAQYADYDVQKHIDRTSRMIEVFDASFFNDMMKLPTSNVSPIFIIGQPRAGKSLTAKILGNHPRIFDAGEVGIERNITHLPKNMAVQGAFPDALSDLNEEQAQVIIERYEKRLTRDADAVAKYCMDSVPTNMMYLALIAVLFPKAKIIHCTREPLDHCLHIYFKDFKNRFYAYSNDLKTLGVYYQQYQRLMAHWHKVLPLRIHEVDYNAMIADSKTETMNLLTHVNLKWKPECLQNIDIRDNEVGDAEHYLKHLKPLMDALSITPA